MIFASNEYNCPLCSLRDVGVGPCCIKREVVWCPNCTGFGETVNAVIVVATAGLVVAVGIVVAHVAAADSFAVEI